MSKLLAEIVRSLESVGGRLSDLRKDGSGSNIYVFEINGDEIVVHSRCLRTFYEALKTLTLVQNKEV